METNMIIDSSYVETMRGEVLREYIKLFLALLAVCAIIFLVIVLICIIQSKRINKIVDKRLGNSGLIGKGQYINGQGRAELHYPYEDDIEYGYDSYRTGLLYNSGDNGCPIYAIYNANITLADYDTPGDIYKYLQTNNGYLLGGGFGSTPFVFDNYFKDKGFEAKNVYFPSIDDLDRMVKENDSVILYYLYWTGGHYIEVHYDEDSESYVIVNEYNESETNRNINSISNHFKDHYGDSSFFITATVINGGK